MQLLIATAPPRSPPHEGVEFLLAAKCLITLVITTTDVVVKSQLIKSEATAARPRIT